MNVVRMEDYSPSIAYKRKIKEQGLRAWRITATLWLCAIHQGELIWFLSQRGESEIISKEDAQGYLALA